MTAPYLQIQGLRMEFGDVVAVHDVTLDIRQGEFLTFLGPSGSGKSTTLYILAGFQQPTRGDILLQRPHPARPAVAPAQYRHGLPALHPVSAT